MKFRELLRRWELQMHFVAIEKYLQAGTLLQYDGKGKIAHRRKQTLDLLREYRRQGEFPQAELSESMYVRRPVFRDSTGVWCAMGYLMYLGANKPLAERIASENNGVYLDNFRDAQYLAALKKLGLTPQEATLVQPGYGWVNPAVPAPWLVFTIVGGLMAVMLAVTMLLLVKFAYFAKWYWGLKVAASFVLLIASFIVSSLVYLLYIKTPLDEYCDRQSMPSSPSVCEVQYSAEIGFNGSSQLGR